MHESIAAWVRTLFTAVTVLFAYLVIWHVWMFASARGRVAYGVGYYRAAAPTFFVIGLMFIAFGLFLYLRR